LPYDPNDPNQDSQQETNQEFAATGRQFDSLNALLRQDPIYQQYLQTHGAGSRDLSDQEKSELMAYAHAHYGVPANTEVSDKGVIQSKDERAKALWTLAAVAAVPLAAYGGAALAGGGGAAGAGGAGAATAGGGASGGAGLGLASTALPAGYVAPVAAGGGLAAGAGAGTTAVTAGAFGHFVSALGGAPALVGTGLNLLGSYLQSRAAGNATQAQIDAANAALAEQRREYDQNLGLNVQQANQTLGFNQAQANNTIDAYNQKQAALAPARAAGNASLSALSYGLGLPGYEQGNRTVVNAPPPYRPVQPINIPPLQLPNGAAATPTSAASSPPQQSATSVPVGTQRMYNGQPIVWDGQGWKAAQQQGAA
jgi:hypothetical protein